MYDQGKEMRRENVFTIVYLASVALTVINPFGLRWLFFLVIVILFPIAAIHFASFLVRVYYLTKAGHATNKRERVIEELPRDDSMHDSAPAPDSPR